MRTIISVLILILCTSGCVTREQVSAELWINDGIPMEMCTGNIVNYGVYRVLDCKPDIPECAGGKKTYQEFIPYCSLRVKGMVSADAAKVSFWLSKLTNPRP